MPEPQQAQTIIPVTKIGEVYFMTASLCVVDLRDYEVGKEDRVVSFMTLGGELNFEDKDADDAYTWWLQFTGQNRIAPA